MIADLYVLFRWTGRSFALTGWGVWFLLLVSFFISDAINDWRRRR